MNNPVIDKSNGNKYWYNESGKLHRENGPACEYASGTKGWYQNGKLHRIDGPAFEFINRCKEWYQNGKMHRIDGPAVEYEDGRKEYWINDVKYDSLEEGLMDLALE